MRGLQSTDPTPVRVLVAGVARSGTSWLGRALGHAEGAVYYHEPDHVGGDFGAYPVIDTDDHENAFTPIWDMVFAGTFPFARDGGRARMRPLARAARRMPRLLRDPLSRGAGMLARRMPARARPIVAKTVHSVLSLDWLGARYQPHVVLIHRHPLSVVSSWRELQMPLFDLATRPRIRERFLEPLAISPPGPAASELHRIAWHVGLLTQVAGDTLARHPEWQQVSHEEVCADPLTRIRDVCGRAGLQWTDQVEAFLSANDRRGDGMDPVRVTSEQPGIWRRRLTASEVDEAEAGLAEFPRRGWVHAPSPAQVAPSVTLT